MSPHESTICDFRLVHASRATSDLEFEGHSILNMHQQGVLTHIPIQDTHSKSLYNSERVLRLKIPTTGMCVLWAFRRGTWQVRCREGRKTRRQTKLPGGAKTSSPSTRVSGVKMCERTRGLRGHPTILSRTHVTNSENKGKNKFNQDKKRKVPDVAERLGSKSEFHVQIYIYV